jgi:hypothetical protein
MAKSAGLPLDALEKPVIPEIKDPFDDTEQAWLDGADDEFDPESYAPPKNTDAPPARPGYVQRWINVADTRRYAQATHQGWKPRKADSVPDDYICAKISDGAFSGAIGIRDSMVLMEMDERLHRKTLLHPKLAQDHRHFAAIQEDALKIKRESDGRVPVSIKGTKSHSPVTGRRPNVQEDDE